MTESSTGLRDALAELLGAEALVPATEQQRYEKGYRYGAGSAAAVLRPGNSEDVRKLIRFCRERQLPLVIQGAHTGLVGAATPDTSGQQLVLSLERLNDAQIDPYNRSATCGAGALLSAVNTAAAEHGLHLPIDLGADPSLGGMLATNTGGARLLRYGDMRHQLLGLEAVLADEALTVVSDLAGLRKNNIGIDLKQLLAGSGGKLGVITKVQVELQPVIRQSATALVRPASLDCIPAIVLALESKLDRMLLACEGMSGRAMAAALDSHPALRRPFEPLPPYALLVEVGSAADLGINISSLLEETLMACMEGEQPLVADAIVGRGPEFWALRHAISDGLKTLGRVIGFDIAVRRDRLPELRQQLLSAIEQEFPQLLACDFGHVADGGMHFNIVVPSATTIDPGTETRLRDRVFGIVVNEFNGSFSAEHGIGPANMVQYQAFRDAGEQRIINAITGIADTHQLFNPASP